MAKIQTRRSISVRGVTYRLVRDYCGGAGISISDFVEHRVAEFFAAHPMPDGSMASPLPSPRPAPRLALKAAASPPAHAPGVAPSASAARPATAVRPASALRPASAVGPAHPLRPTPVARPVPSVSTLVNRPAPPAARRAISPPVLASAPSLPATLPAAPANRPTPRGDTTGRPAPTPAAAVLKERLTPAAPRDAKDYRALRF